MSEDKRPCNCGWCDAGGICVCKDSKQYHRYWTPSLSARERQECKHRVAPCPECGGPLVVVTSPDDIDKVGCTMYQVCEACGEAR